MYQDIKITEDVSSQKVKYARGFPDTTPKNNNWETEKYCPCTT